MISQVRAATQGIMLPEDREKLALLEREKRADLAAILTPAELEDYEMRNSTITMRLRGALTLMDATAEEYRAIYRAQLPFTDLLYPTGPGMTVYTAETSRQRNEAQKQVSDQIRAALGEQRYAEYSRANNYEYQNLYRVAQRENVPIEAVNRIFYLRTSVTEESMRIHDSKLAADARTAALQALVADTKAKVIINLGSTLAETYLKNLFWLSAIERGYGVRLSPDGSGMSYMSAPQPNPDATAATFHPHGKSATWRQSGETVVPTPQAIRNPTTDTRAIARRVRTARWRVALRQVHE